MAICLLAALIGSLSSFKSASFIPSAVALTVARTTFIASAAASTMVLRIVLAWKKLQVSDTLILRAIASVLALLPSISDNERNSAMTAIISATCLFTPLA